MGLLIRAGWRALREARNGWQRRRVRRQGLSRLTPFSLVFGFDRGTPIDRTYIDNFLSKYRTDVRGRILEIGDRSYTTRYGEGRIIRSDVLHAEPGNYEATLIGDLATGIGIPHRAFDCMIITQTLPFVYDVSAAVNTIRACLRPDGVALVTVPGICQISRFDMDQWGDYWRFTDASVRRLFGDVFGQDNVTVVTYGNVLTACAFLQGLASHELGRDELDYRDPNYQVLIGVRAVRRGNGQ